MLHIKVVGPGCPNCERLAQLCQEILAETELDGFVEKISDINQFSELGVILTPSLIVNHQMVSSGKIPTKHTLRHRLEELAKETK